jgi:tetratricopeptide (TPR) repeat protein
MTMALSYYGWADNQYTAANWMKPHKEDKNVSPWQMVRFVNDFTGLKSLYRYGGTTTLLKRLLAADFPVVIEESIQPGTEGWMGHYVLLVGYDDYSQEFVTYDSYLGQDRRSAYLKLDDTWRHFNRIFMVIYEPSRELELRQALGEYVDPVYGYRIALETARYEAQRSRDDKWAWFNMGTAYVQMGEYENAAYAYDEAFRLGLPFRMLWYQFGPYEAYFHTGRYSDVLARATQSKNTTPYVEESYYWAGMAYAAQGDRSNAISKFDEALRFNRNFYPAQEARAQVESGTFSVASAQHP